MGNDNTNNDKRENDHANIFGKFMQSTECLQLDEIELGCNATPLETLSHSLDIRVSLELQSYDSLTRFGRTLTDQETIISKVDMIIEGISVLKENTAREFRSVRHVLLFFGVRPEHNGPNVFHNPTRTRPPQGTNHDHSPGSHLDRRMCFFTILTVIPKTSGSNDGPTSF